MRKINLLLSMMLFIGIIAFAQDEDVRDEPVNAEQKEKKTRYRVRAIRAALANSRPSLTIPPVLPSDGGTLGNAAI